MYQPLFLLDFVMVCIDNRDQTRSTSCKFDKNSYDLFETAIKHGKIEKRKRPRA